MLQYRHNPTAWKQDVLPREIAQKHPLVVFTLLAYGLAWPVWLFARGQSGPSLFLTWLGGFAPAIAALLLTALLEGRQGLSRLLSSAFQWRVPPLYYLVVLGLPLAGTALLTALVALIQRDPAPLALLGPWLAALGRGAPVFLLTLLLGLVVVAGEEFGWRGFLLPRLRERRSDLTSSLLVGLVWGLWHLPDLWPFQARYNPLDLLVFMLDIVIISVIYTWLFARSRGSLLLVSLFHAMYNFVVMVAPAGLPFVRQARGYEIAVWLLCAAIIVAIHGPRRFGPTVEAAQPDPAIDFTTHLPVHQPE